MVKGDADDQRFVGVRVTVSCGDLRSAGRIETGHVDRSSTHTVGEAGTGGGAIDAFPGTSTSLASLTFIFDPPSSSFRSTSSVVGLLSADMSLLLTPIDQPTLMGNAKIPNRRRPRPRRQSV